MGKIPVVLDLMRPMFTILFPRLLPLMMLKVMPLMLRRVAEQVSMPDDMREQTEESMPKVVDHLILPVMLFLSLHSQ